MIPPLPTLTVRGPATGARAVVLVLPGGQVASSRPARRGLAWARMLPFLHGVARATRGSDVAVWLLRYRVRGWNEPALDPVLDARWALAVARGRHPGARIVLVGHSMGGRVALRLVGDADVTGVCGLAPWIEADEPARTGDAEILIAHGDRDRVTSAEASAAYAARSGATFRPVPGVGHAMLRRPLLWQHLVVDFVLDRLRTTRHRR